ncbi:hypothetical protein NON08_11095 [Cetobacterium somerae]|nr:hypothetical protein [Cetobacterium sp. NK01]MCQ8213060.1 hypothetical protein [Cetobacterium sp. NK01]
MRFKRVSNHFWRVESNGFIIVGTWEQCQKELLNLSLKKYLLKN